MPVGGRRWLDLGRAERVAVIADVQGNALALEAVLGELEPLALDRVVFLGDLTYGPLPVETFELLRPFAESAIFIRGDSERELLAAHELRRAGGATHLGERGLWMLDAHDSALMSFLATFVVTAALDIPGLGAVRFCHGSPRSDEEQITSRTPELRMEALLEGVTEDVLVSAHSQIQFDRQVLGVRSVSPGSVGQPHEGRMGAYWAVLGPDVELRRTEYDIEEAVRRFRASGDPLAEELAEFLCAPPMPESTQPTNRVV